MNPKLISLTLVLALTVAACGSKTTSPSPATPEAREASKPQAGGDLKLSAAQIQAADIELATAGPASLRDTLPLYGVVAPNAERMRNVTARYPGVIRAVSHTVGDAVKQGETLANVESNESLQSYAVTAPLTGVITTRQANVGEQTGDRTLFVVADLSTVWVELSLFPRDAAKIHVGQSVLVRSPDVGRTGDGRVTYLAPFGSATNQTLTARVALDNSRRQWAPGLYVSADVTLAERAAPLTVKRSAVQVLHDASVVFVRTASGFEARPVKAGRSDGDLIEILEGLKPGDSYAANNSYVLKAEALKSEAAEE